MRNTSVLVISTHIQMIFCVFFLFYYLLFLNVQIKIMGKERKSVNPHLIDEMILPCQKCQNNFLVFQVVLIHRLWILFVFLANLSWIQVNWHYILKKSHQNIVLHQYFLIRHKITYLESMEIFHLKKENLFSLFLSYPLSQGVRKQIS